VRNRVHHCRSKCNVCRLTDDVLVVTETEATSVPSFEETYRDNRLPLVRLAFLMCGSRDLSEDLVQTAFTSTQSRWREIDNHVAYLRRAVVNLAKDGQRQRYRWLRVAPLMQSESVTLPPEIDETWALLLRLPSAQRAVIVLHYYEDLSLVEVADILNRSASTVRSDLRRALGRLRKELT
jgi:RNA polymerase sigma factor (sigma-70 family)